MSSRSRASSDSCFAKSYRNATSLGNERSKLSSVRFAENHSSDINATGEMAILLEELFRFHATGRNLDADKFLQSQALVAIDAGSKFDRMESMSRFLDLVESNNSKKAPFDNFCTWQVNSLKQRGFDEVQMLHFLEESLRCLRPQRCSYYEDHHSPDLRWKGSEVFERAVLHSLGKNKEDNAEKMKAMSKSEGNLVEEKLRQKRLAELSKAQSQDEAVIRNGKKQLVKLGKLPSDSPQNNQANTKILRTVGDAIVNQAENETPSENNKEGINSNVQWVRHDKMREAIGKQSWNEQSKEDITKQFRKEKSKENIIKQSWKETSKESIVKSATQSSKTQHAPQKSATQESSISLLAKSLTTNAASDEQRAWAIYVWVCSNIKYDVDGLHGRAPRKPCDAESVLKGRICVCAGYAHLYESLCKEAGLDAKYITGKARTSTNKIGESLSEEDDSHAWNVVSLQGKWYLVDCCWGAGSCTDTEFTPKLKPHYFCTDPRAFAFSHFPNDASWQLLPRALTLESFIAQPQTYSAFFEHELAFVPEDRPVGVVALKGGNQGSIKLKVPQGIDLMVKIDGDEERCFQIREGGLVRIYFRVPKTLKQQVLAIYAAPRATNSANSRSYDAVCNFSVVGPVGPTGHVEPWFPKIWQEPFAKHGLGFAEQLPSGLLRPDDNGTISVKLKVPTAKKVIANLKKNSGTEKLDACCRNLESGVVEVSCHVAKKFEGILTVYANETSASTFDAVMSFRVEG